MTARLTRRGALGGLIIPWALPPLRALADTAPLEGSVSVTVFGAKGNGAADDTEALLRAHASGKAIYYPRTGAFYRISGALPLISSASSNGAEIRIIGDGRNAKTIFRISANTRPITISGFVLDGGYKGGTQGEWSHGIDLSGAKNVTITANTIRNTYGDCVFVDSANTSGVFVTRVKGPVASSNIRIYDNKLVNPRRCNVAVVCGENVVIEGNTCVKESDYVAAIDLEPDINRFDYVHRVKILENRFYTTGKFLTAGVNNGITNTDLVVARNHGQAFEFFRAYENALLRNATITRNRFSATSPQGTMFDLRAVEGVVSDNVDETACGVGYSSAKFWKCKISVARNVFCS